MFNVTMAGLRAGLPAGESSRAESTPDSTAKSSDSYAAACARQPGARVKPGHGEKGKIYAARTGRGMASVPAKRIVRSASNI